MHALRVVTDLAECQDVWQRAMPSEVVSDLWEFRACFQRHFQRPPYFLVAEDGRDIAGLLPLSWIEEASYYGCFPGEVWQGKTWLEQNRIIGNGDGMLRSLLDRCPGPYHLRYLLPLGAASQDQRAVDEVGYLFRPPDYDYDMENYFRQFSHKSAKRLKRELASIEDLGVRYRYDDPGDFDRLVQLNIGGFGDHSYFHDARFRESFRSVMQFLGEKGWLRVTTLLIGGEIAAIDMGCIRHGAYTLLAGGTDGSRRGVAKLINVHHMRRGCQERLKTVDFLCGDFSWKTLFHLTPRPLYVLSSSPAEQHASQDAQPRSAEYVG